MPTFIAILEDDAPRIETMRHILMELLPQYQPIFFDHATKMIAWLTRHLQEVVLLSLDHDLPINRGSGEDHGCGRDIANHLTTVSPTCPIIVHSSNASAAAGMVRVLGDAGWPVWQVTPFGDLEWVSTAWADQLHQLIDRGWVFEMQEPDRG